MEASQPSVKACIRGEAASAHARDGRMPSCASEGPRSGRTGRRASSTICLAIAAAFLARDGARAYDSGPRAYLNAEACKAAHALSDAECQTAYANAKAEFDEKAPRFSARGECERYFRRCMIGDISGGRVTFVPQMRGFRIDSARRRLVVPVPEGGDAGALFQPREIDRTDAFVSSVRKAEAQRTWKAMISPRPATAAPGPSAESAPAGDQAVEPAGSGEPQSFPVPPALLQDLQARERQFGTASKPQ